jgi:hypothetical protein
VSSTNLSFRTPPDLMQKFRDRDIKGVENPGAIAKRDVERWYSLLGESLKAVHIEPVEAVVMIFAANWSLSGMNGQTLADLPETLRREVGLHAFYREAQLDLAEETERWPLSVRAALWDAAERYDVVAHKEPGLTFGATLHRVGLHSYDLTPEELALVEGIPAVESDSLPGVYMKATISNGET